MLPYTDIPADFRLFPAQTSAERQVVYDLRYKGYLAKNAIPASEDQRFFDEFDERSNCPSFLLAYKGDIVGTVRACVYLDSPGWDDIPSFGMFRYEIFNAVGSGRRLVEINRLVLLPIFHDEHRRDQTEEERNAKFTMKRLLDSVTHFIAETMFCDYVVASVRKEHAHTFEKMLFKAVSNPKRYHGVTFDTICLLNNWKENVSACEDTVMFYGLRGYLEWPIAKCAAHAK